MARGTRTIYPSERNKGLSSTFQPPEEGQSIQWLKHCDKHGDKDENNSLKNVNNVHNIDRNLKTALTSDLTLTHYDSHKEIYVASNTSNLGLGAVLLHKEKDGQLKVVHHVCRFCFQQKSIIHKLKKRG